MTKDEVKKALKHCSSVSADMCVGCPYAKCDEGDYLCSDGRIYKDALEALTKQEQEIKDIRILVLKLAQQSYDKFIELLLMQQREIDKLNVVINQHNYECFACNLNQDKIANHAKLAILKALQKNEMVIHDNFGLADLEQLIKEFEEVKAE